MLHPDFHWVEFRAVGQRARTLVPVKLIEQEMERLPRRPENVHISIFRYDSQIETYWEENGHSVKGYRGPAYADYIPLEIDGPSREELGKGVETARSAIAALKAKWGLSYEDLAVYYSGRRGFHLLIPTEHFGAFQPHERFHDVLFELVAELFVGTGVIREIDTEGSGPAVTSDHVDLGVFSRLHMLRMPCTVHQDSQLWKIPVREEELMSGPPGKAAERVQEAAGEWRPPYRPDPNPNRRTEGLGETIRERIGGEGLKFRRESSVYGEVSGGAPLTSGDLAGLDKPGFGRFAVDAEKTKKVLVGGMEEGQSIMDIAGRRDALCHLVGKLAGTWNVPKDAALPLLHHWNQSNDPPLPEKEFKAVIDDLYARH